MMEIDKKKIRMWSMLGARRTFGAVLDEIATDMPDIFVLSGDLVSSSGLDRFTNNNPEKIKSAGISEQNMVTVASGLASEGKVVFVTSFSPFVTGRCYDQIRINLGYMHHNVKLVGLAAGIGVGIQGNSHYGLDDVAIMRTIPGMTVVEPADCTEVVKAITACYSYDGPVYLRLIGEQGAPSVYPGNYDFQLGKAIKLREGSDITIIASGTMVYQSIKAAKILAESGVEATVVNMHTIKPLDTKFIEEAVAGKKLVVTVQEAYTIGGLGSAVSEYLSQYSNTPPCLHLGIKDEYPHAGTYKWMLRELGLDAEGIAASIKAKLG